MPSPLRSLAAHALGLVRQVSFVHRPVHALAVRMMATRWGASFVRSVLHAPTLEPLGYEVWAARYDVLTAADRSAIRAHIAAMAHRPPISVVMPVYATSPKLLKAAIESVRAQLYPNWELCIADDASPGDAVWRLLSRYAARDCRIKLVRRPVNGHICAATNSALELARGDFVALMDHDDLLPRRALYEVAAVLDRHPDADIVYSDEDKIDGRGLRFEPYFKTDWNYDLLLGQNMVSHLGVYRRSLVEAVGGLRVGFEGSQDYDLTLRIAERTTRDRIHHIPWVLYHWRQQAGTASFSESQMARCADAARRAVEEHLDRTGQPGCEVTNLPGMPGWVRVRRPIPAPAPLVSIVVPTRDRAELLGACADGVLHRTDYAPLELLIVDNGSVEPETHALFAELRKDPRVRILAAPGPFNFSALNNRAAAQARGEVLVLLNNDVSLERSDWLTELVSHAVRPRVGAVGAKLDYPDGTVQHAGVAIGVGGVAAHFGPGAGAADRGYFGHLAMIRDVSAVTAACLALRKSVFDEVGGLDAEGLAVAFNDVDLCLKIRAAGYDIVWTPFAELTHHESASRGSDLAPGALARFNAEVAAMRARWGDVLDSDPFYGPNFDRQHTDFRLAYPPARKPPWRA
ncbi:glycosyltransferase family 2 protein [Phenylobacterium sp.]|uniref:glycosyltransferase family 2 protein n=1 Tax=Phenylobacterium sp. TaxID=1871053 RepID=UPI0025DDA5D3|nr:glycosyltransferase family 2 protein [Phenylobacterium sp.]